MCKLEHYGNCDPETKDQEYCIFHKPNKNEEEAREFWRKFLERFKPKKEKIFIEEVQEEIERFVFEDVVDCSGFIFPSGFSLYYSIFEKLVHFNSALFEGPVIFVGVIFKERANFAGAIFKGYAGFKGTVFRDDAIFKTSKFEGYANFVDATFDTVSFEDAKFEFKLDFSALKFRMIDIDIPHENFKLPEAEAEACRVQRLFYEKEGNKDKADEMFLRERRALRSAKVRQAKEQLNKSNCIKSKLKALINLFKAYIGASIEFILADLTCGYGTNWIKPIVLWIFTVLILCPLLYLVTNSIPNAYDFLSCLYFSIVTATTLGYGDLHPVGIGRALASAEAIFGTFMWAVFLAVFARKYMR